jgi:hypothetical protein
MKTSNKIIFISLASLGGLVLITAIVSRIMIGAFAGDNPRGDLTVRTENLKDFSAIQASAVWDLHVTRGDDFSVKLTVDNQSEKGILVRREGETLVLDRRYAGLRARGGATCRADIIMPALSALDFSGVGSVVLSGFTGQSFRLSSSGTGSVICRDSVFHDLTVSLSGVGSIDFSGAGAVNADVELSGLGSLKLRMDGGELRGAMSGMGSIEYTGIVTAERINKSGLGSVEHK